MDNAVVIHIMYSILLLKPYWLGYKFCNLICYVGRSVGLIQISRYLIKICSFSCNEINPFLLSQNDYLSVAGKTLNLRLQNRKNERKLWLTFLGIQIRIFNAILPQLWGELHSELKSRILFKHHCGKTSLNL